MNVSFYPHQLELQACGSFILLILFICLIGVGIFGNTIQDTSEKASHTDQQM